MARGLDKLNFHWTFCIARMRKARMHDNAFRIPEFGGRLIFAVIGLFNIRSLLYAWLA